ncbi:DEAD/DEAH box helicase [Mycolicibacterium komossense]|uniref:DEAD/DEAH box helicase n=1 Tax=Mycolicibacterium komossense TaxID=1779 RepID=A0ABT3CG20_9MYCO|nr:DEAD/DEAH box helicase [Mycolicibacterium komossense]MCV7228452.1 DEAD/DEAH box helicase [Mycolicibacterium komossense]
MTVQHTSDKTFADLGVREPLVRALSERGITQPFPIQIETLPDTLSGRDVLGRGKTGSGKTLAFSLPLVSRLADGRRQANKPSGLVLAPTRELATQITATLEPLAAAYNLKITTIFGGVSQSRQVAALRGGVDIVVACPGRLEDLMRQRLITLDAVQITVIDEADHMADLGFLPGVTRILAATPSGGQRMLFSATLDNGVDKLVNRFLQNQVSHSVDEENSPVAAMTHHVFHVSGVEAKRKLVQHLASGTGRRILFMRTKHQARKLAKQLTDSGVPSVDLHGNLSQPARDRNLAAFTSGEARVLVATDIAARGVHVDDVELVVHVDPPMEHKAYLHRSGRTARAGSSGDVVTVVLPEQRRDTNALLRKAGINVKPQEVVADSAPVQALVGELAPYQAPPAVKAAPPQQPQHNRRPSSGGGSSRGARGGGARGGAARSSGTPARGAGSSARTGTTYGAGATHSSGVPRGGNSVRPERRRSDRPQQNSR